MISLKSRFNARRWNTMKKSLTLALALVALVAVATGDAAAQQPLQHYRAGTAAFAIGKDGINITFSSPNAEHSVCRGRPSNEHSRILADFRLHVLQPAPQESRRLRGATQEMRRRCACEARCWRFSRLDSRRL